MIPASTSRTHARAAALQRQFATAHNSFAPLTPPVQSLGVLTLPVLNARYTTSVISAISPRNARSVTAIAITTALTARSAMPPASAKTIRSVVKKNTTQFCATDLLGVRIATTDAQTCRLTGASAGLAAQVLLAQLLSTNGENTSSRLYGRRRIQAEQCLFTLSPQFIGVEGKTVLSR